VVEIKANRLLRENVLLQENLEDKMLKEKRRPSIEIKDIKVEVKNLSFFYGNVQALKDVNINIAKNQITALIGASGCGKTTFLRCLNRMHDLYSGNIYKGEVLLHPGAVNIIDTSIDPILIRMKVGMVFQKPNPFPKSIYENVAYGLRIKGIKNKKAMDEKVEWALRASALWEEVKDRLKENAYSLSGGQQQRLCIARAIAVEPEVLLFDEPTSALDPMSTLKIEELALELKKYITIVIVTHNMQQAARIADYTAFMHLGKLIEFDTTEKIFTNPSNKLTEDYITGRFG
jgi:phosphate transport system ATP-binding protein